MPLNVKFVDLDFIDFFLGLFKGLSMWIFYRNGFSTWLLKLNFYWPSQGFSNWMCIMSFEALKRPP